MKQRILAILLVFPTTAIFAHEGHGQYPATQVFHYLTSPEHIIQTSLVIAAFAGYLLFQGIRKLRTGKR